MMKKHQIFFILSVFLYSTTACAGRDTALIMSHAINNKLIEPYYHTDTFPKRIPLRIMKNQLVKTEFKLTKFGVPVLYVVDSPHMVITKLDFSEDRAVIELHYLPEGIRLEMQLSKSSGDWKEVNSKLIEE